MVIVGLVLSLFQLMSGSIWVGLKMHLCSMGWTQMHHSGLKRLLGLTWAYSLELREAYLSLLDFISICYILYHIHAKKAILIYNIHILYKMVVLWFPYICLMNSVFLLISKSDPNVLVGKVGGPRSSHFPNGSYLDWDLD